MTSAPTIPITAPVIIDWNGDDIEPCDAFVDALVEILWDASERQLEGQDGDQAGDAVSCASAETGGR